LIFDEVITGFRHHVGGAQALYGVTPDLGVFGKAMANGYPISALAGRRDIMSYFMPEGPVYISGTFMGHLLGVTAALATIELLRDGSIHARLQEVGERIARELTAVIDELELNAHCVSFGSIWCLYFTRGPIRNFRDIIHMTKYAKQYPKDLAFRTTLLNNGIYLQPHYTNRAFISAAHDDADINRTIEVTLDYLRAHQEVLRRDDDEH
jgi:glutamate-1-semialdehyde 2,1-aminomutase